MQTTSEPTPRTGRDGSVIAPSTPMEKVRPSPTVSIVIPALNEARNLPHVLSKLPPVDEVILVDGGSTDDTIAVATRLRPDIRVVAQNRKGKGNALACGFAAATGDVIVMIDADGSTSPEEIPLFVAALCAGADFAKGSRFAPTGGSLDITRTRQIGNKFLNTLVNVMYGTRYSDLCYGYNAFWARCMPHFSLDTTSPRPSGDGRLWGDGFEIETLLNLRAARANLRVTEVPSFEHPRIHGASNLNAVKDGIRVLRTIAREWRRSQPTATATTASWSGTRSLTGTDN
jgi:glycosyltransferase involved in cell wall biosynthesis